jgi:cation-transporting ATPase E
VQQAADETTDLAGDGLTTAQVAQRRAEGKGNDVPDPTSRSLADIARANIFTPFNFLLGTLLVVILVVREYRDALFGIVLVANALIGIVQEWRSKRALDRLALLNAPRVTAVRDGSPVEVGTAELVLDDLLVVSAGDQIPVDGAVLASQGLEIDESLLTGEADPVDKAVGNQVLSGSFVAAGSGRVRATAVGADAYAFKLASEARRFSLVRSELRDGINRLIRLIGWMMIPTAILLVTAQIRADEGVVSAVQGSVAGLVAMVPEGLVLLTSLAFAVGAMRLARKKVLTQELAAIEWLARVDVICLDKTGTITEGKLVLATVEHLGGAAADSSTDGSTDGAAVAPAALAALAAADDHPNPSLLAVAAEFPDAPGWALDEIVPFSSARKWSAASFQGHGTWYLGAPDILLTQVAEPGHAPERLQHYAEQGRRVLMLAAAPDGLDGDRLPPRLDPVALVVLEEKVRDTAPDTIAYFESQGVTVKVISGDNPVTVAAVAQRVGVAGAEHAFDARQLPDDPEALAEVLDTHAVFGRVTPQQKRSMVHALQSRGHVVAMTGDGVNDTLALKDADIGVAMGSGSPAARAVARFVVLSNDFSVFPSVVAEGRRVIANIERVANLFLTKTFYALVLALAVGVAGMPFPFIPRHLTLISGLTIGIPGFFLALAPNARRATTGFLKRVLRFAIPAGIVAAVATLVSYQVARTREEVPIEEARTVAVLTLFVVAYWVLGILARPFNAWRLGLVAAMGGLFVGALAIPWFNDYFEVPIPDTTAVVTGLGVGAVACLLLEVAWQVAGWLHRNTDLDLEMGGR